MECPLCNQYRMRRDWSPTQWNNYSPSCEGITGCKHCRCGGPGIPYPNVATGRKLEVVVVVVVVVLVVVVLVLARPETEAELRRYWIDVKGIKDKGSPASTASPKNSGLYFCMDAAAGCLSKGTEPRRRMPLDKHISSHTRLRRAHRTLFRPK